MTSDIDDSGIPSREEAILRAARELLSEGGAPALTVEAVAARSGVAKTTIYRRWGSRHELALAVVLDLVKTASPVPDLGNTKQELIEFLGRAVRVLGTTLMGPVMQGVVSEFGIDHDLATVFRERVIAGRVHEVHRILDRGVARGEIRDGVDAEQVHELLFGAVYYRLLLSGDELDGDLARRTVEAIYQGIGAPTHDP